jgi:hypothetical protein
MALQASARAAPGSGALRPRAGVVDQLEQRRLRRGGIGAQLLGRATFITPTTGSLTLAADRDQARRHGRTSSARCGYVRRSFCTFLCRCLGRAFQFAGKIKGCRAILARCAVAQVHEVREQVGNGVVPIRVGANLELADCGLCRLRTGIVLASGSGGKILLSVMAEISFGYEK